MCFGAGVLLSPPSFRTNKMRRRVGSAMAWSARSSEASEDMVDYRYRGNRRVSIYDYFFKIGLYPSPISRVRIASASFTSPNGPSCTRNNLSVVACGATNAGYSFFFSASTSASASSCLLTAATCTKYAEGGNIADESFEFAGGFEAGALVAVEFAAVDAFVSVFASAGGVSCAFASF